MQRHLWSLYQGRKWNRVKKKCIISRDWVGVGEGGFEQSSSWVSLFDIARKFEVRNLIIGIHYGAVIIIGIVAKEKCIISRGWLRVGKGGFQ